LTLLRAVGYAVVLLSAAVPGAGAQSDTGAGRSPVARGSSALVHRLAEARRDAPAGVDVRLAGVVSSRQPLVRARTIGLDLERDAIRVVLEPAAGTAGAVAAAHAVGATVEASAAGLIQALVRPSQLRALGADSRVHLVRPPARMLPSSVGGEGVAAAGADLVHAAGASGSGVKVAVIDGGFAGYQQRQAEGDLPASLTTKDFCGGDFATTDDHGTAVAEIVHEVAPGAQLYLICIDSEVTLAQAEQYAEAEGIRIVNHSIGWFGPFRGDGTGDASTPAGIVARAARAGILWVNSAGNTGRSHVHANYSDTDLDGLSSWTGFPDDEFTEFTVEPGETVCGLLRWEGWPQTSEDIDLALVDMATMELLAASAEDQMSTPSEPYEEACWTNPAGSQAWVGAVAVGFSTAGAPRLDLTVLGGSDLTIRTDESVTDPASSPYAIAVGAACWMSGSGVDSYSSRGATIDGRPKPDLVGYDAVSSGTYGPFSSCGASGFTGTSAAAPHVAGALALLAQQYPLAGRETLQAKLEADATDMGVAGRDVTFGAGRVAVYPAATGGGSILYARDVPDNANQHLFLAEATGGGTVPLVQGGSAEAVTSASPDGSKIVYPCARLCVINRDGTGLTQLTVGSRPSAPAWSPAGNKIAFTDVGGLDKDIFVMNADGTGRVNVTFAYTADDTHPTWSPDGTKIAFAGDGGVFVMNADGTGVTRLTTDDNDETPSWSPAGGTIAFVRSGTGTTTIWLMNEDGSGQAPLVPGRAPAWSPDGTKLAFSETVRDPGLERLRTVNADGTGAATVVWYPQSDPLWPTWLPATKPAAVAPPTIGGSSRASGTFVRALPGVWTGSPTSYSYGWERCFAGSCTPIPGVTGSVYRPASSDLGTTLRVVVTAGNSLGSSSRASTEFGPILKPLPTLLAPPVISGNAVVGSKLVLATFGTWANDPTSFSTGVWRRCNELGCRDITSASGSFYTLTSADVGSSISIRVLASHSDGGTSVNARWTAPVTTTAVSGGGGGGGGGAADLAIEGFAQPAAAGVGDDVTYTLRVRTANGLLAQAVNVDIALPGGSQLTGSSVDRGSGCAGGLVCNLDFLSAAAPVGTIRLQTKITAAGGQSLRATVRYALADPNQANNTVTVFVAGTTAAQPPPAQPPAVQPPATITKIGTAGANALRGTARADILRGRGGNDRLWGRGGTDRLFGDAGHDLLYGEAGSDRLYGGSGNDRLFGGPGRDLLEGGTGNDVISARDRMRDTIRCGKGRDTVTADRMDIVSRDCERVTRR
jgi:hypothetical protein